MKKPRLGFIGQGWIGKNYADYFESEGFEVVRYSLEAEHRENGKHIKDCDIVFIAVPTPTTPQGSDDAIVRDVVKLVGKGKIAVIKSTVLPGTTEQMQKENPEIYALHFPEFLTEATAAHDVQFPTRNIIGVPAKTEIFLEKAKFLLSILPQAPYSKICSSREAELIKYGRNVLGYFRVMFVNILYDLANNLRVDWEVIREAMAADPDNGPTYMNPVHRGGRGAGGHCYIKDFAAFVDLYEKKVGDTAGINMLRSLEKKNIALLRATNKSRELLDAVYGKAPKEK